MNKKRSLIFVIVALLSITSFAPSKPAEREKSIEQSVRNPSWTWVEVKNPNGIKNGNGFHDFNDSCGVAEGGRLEKIKTIGERVLTRYASPKDQGYGTECGNGTIFWMDRVKYEHAEAEYNAIVTARELEKDYIWRILRFGNNAPSK